MKRIFFMSFAVAAMFFASCSKDDGGRNEEEKTQLSIKLAGVITTKAVEEPGKTGVGTIDLQRGHIFVLDQAGSVIYNEALDVDAAKNGREQTLASKVPLASSVYIVGNYVDFDASSLSSLSAIKAKAAEITTQGDYTTAALANHDGLSVGIEPVSYVCRRWPAVSERKM